MACWRASWLGDDVGRAGRGRASNTSNIGISPSGPVVLLVANTSNFKHSASSRVKKSFSSSLVNVCLIFVKALRNGAWYRSSIPIDPGYSTGASSIVIPSAAALHLKSFDIYEDHWSTDKKSDGPKYFTFHKASICLHISDADWSVRKTAA